MSSLAILPALHSSGSSQRGSARLSRPAVIENQTLGPNCVVLRGAGAAPGGDRSSGAECWVWYSRR